MTLRDYFAAKAIQAMITGCASRGESVTYLEGMAEFGYQMADAMLEERKKMKVKELIERLQQLDPELMVVRSGYEGGVSEVKNVDIEPIALHVNTPWYYGEHEIIYGDDDQYEGKARTTAVYIT
jgi:hypothetical protein